MGSADAKYGLEHALGKTAIPRVISPTIRGSVRRANPDGGHASPYFLGLDTKTLTVEVSPVGDVPITFVSDDLDVAISTINAASPANLKASDDDGYLRLTNLNSGSKNKIVIKSGTSLDILGFVATPEPGSASFAGDLATAAPGRSIISTQSNPQGTAFVALDEDLTSSVLNRAVFGSTRHIESLVRSLDTEIPVIKRLAVTVVSHVPTGKKVFVVQDDTLRFPIQGFGLSGNPAPAAAFDKLITLRTNATDLDVVNPLQASTFPRVSAVYYNDGSNATANNALNFTTWGTIDGKSIFASQTINKQAPAAITAIRGNVLVVPTAQFLTKVCQPGDTLIIESANNNVPFNHNGEYIIVEVLSETKVVVRPKSPAEITFVSSEKPTELNSNLPGGTVYGNARVVIGAAIPMSKLMFEVDSWVPLGAYFARILTFKRLGNVSFQELGETLHPGNAGLGAVLNTHFTGLAAHSSLNITADAVPGSPYSLLSGTVDSQTAAIINILNTLLVASTVAYAGGDEWADGTTNPATTVELQLDKIILDLADVDGYAKIGANDGPNWADGTTNTADSLANRLDKIISDLAGATGSGKVQGVVVGTDLAVGTVQAQIANLAANWLKMSRANTIGGAQTFSALITASLGMTVTAGGITVTAGGIDVTAGGIDINAGGLQVDEISDSGAGLVDVLTDLNVQGDLTTQGDIKHTDRVLNIPGSDGRANANTTLPSNGYEGSIQTTGAATIIWNIPLNVGDRIKSVTLRVQGDGAADFTALDVMVRNGGTLTPLHNSDPADNTPGSPTVTVLTADNTDHTLAAGDVIIVGVVINAANMKIFSVEVTYDRP